MAATAADAGDDALSEVTLELLEHKNTLMFKWDREISGTSENKR